MNDVPYENKALSGTSKQAENVSPVKQPEAVSPSETARPRRRRKNPGDLASLRRVLWQAIRDVEDIIADPPSGTTIDQRLRAVQALATIGGVYLKAHEAHEVLQRVEALEEAVRQSRGVA